MTKKQKLIFSRLKMNSKTDKKSKNHYGFFGDKEFTLHGDSIYSTEIDNDFDPEGNRYGQRYAMTLKEYQEIKKIMDG